MRPTGALASWCSRAMVRSGLALLCLTMAACDSGGGGSGAQDAAGGADAAVEDTAGPPAGAAVRIVRACSFAAACTFGPVVTTDTASCVERLANHVAGGSEPWKGQVYERLLACADDATTCAEFTSCGRLERTCAQAGVVCDGDVLLDCKTAGDNVPAVLDCAAFGMTCDASGGAPSCTTGAACAEAEAACDGDTLVTCEEGREQRFACSAGTTCFTMEGEAACARLATDCADRSASCDGDTAVICYGPGVGFRYECAAAGRTCGQDAPPPFEFCAPLNIADECLAAAMPEPSCAAGVIHTCADGQPIDIPCAALGASECAENLAGLPYCQ